VAVVVDVNALLLPPLDVIAAIAARVPTERPAIALGGARRKGAGRSRSRNSGLCDGGRGHKHSDNGADDGRAYLDVG
jgi:hypothetical protein